MAYNYIYSEIEQEGRYAGVNTVFVDFFNGKSPDGGICDSNFGFDEAAILIMGAMTNEFNPRGFFKHPKTGLYTPLGFRGESDPLRAKNQKYIMGCLNALYVMLGSEYGEANLPKQLHIETCGIYELKKSFMKSDIINGTSVSFSVTPSFITDDYDLDFAIISQLYNFANVQLKFIVNADTYRWAMLDRNVGLLRAKGIYCPIWVKPDLSETKERHEFIEQVVADRAQKRGYNIIIASN